MTDLAEEAREGSSLEIAVPEAQPQCAQRARSVALPSPLPSSPVTVRVRDAGVKVSAIAATPGTLLHAQPPTLVQAHARHRECADHLKSPFLRRMRMGWGWFHMATIKPALNLLEVYTMSPLAFLVVVLLGLAVWFFS